MGAEVGRYRHVNQPERKKRGKDLSVCSGMLRRERAPNVVVAAQIWSVTSLTTSFSSPSQHS